MSKTHDKLRQFKLRTLSVSLCCGLSLTHLVACQSPELGQGQNPIARLNIPRITAAEAAQEKSELETKIQKFLANPSTGNLSLGKPLDSALEAQRQTAIGQAVLQRRKNSASISLNGTVLMPPELPHADLVNAITNNNQSKLAAPVPLANHGVIARGPDGKTLALTTTNLAGQYSLSGLPSGMRIQVVAYNSHNREVAKALVDVPSDNPPASLTQDLTPISSAIAETLWLAQKDGRSGLEQVSVKQITAELSKDATRLDKLARLHGLLHLVAVEAETQKGILQENLDKAVTGNFRTQGAFGSGGNCTWRSWLHPSTGFQVQQVNTPYFDQFLKDNDVLSIRLIAEAQVETARAGADLRAQSSSLTPDMGNTVGTVATSKCGSEPTATVPQTSPVLTKVSKDTAFAGETITLSGTGLLPSRTENVVKFGNTIAKIIGVVYTFGADGQENVLLQVKAPNPEITGAVGVTVTVNGKTSNSLPFTAKGGITALSAYTGKLGDEIKLTGVFLPSPTVWFNEKPITGVTAKSPVQAEVIKASESEITIKVPQGLGKQYYHLSISDAEPFKKDFDLSPTLAFADGTLSTTLKTTQSNTSFNTSFLESPSLLMSGLDGMEGVIQELTPGSKEMPWPTSTGTLKPTKNYSLWYKKDQRISNKITFAVPTYIGIISPNIGIPGDIVRIFGAIDKDSAANNTIKFGTVKAESPTLKDNILFVKVPPDISGTPSVTLTVNGVESNAVSFPIRLPDIVQVNNEKPFLGSCKIRVFKDILGVTAGEVEEPNCKMNINEAVSGLPIFLVPEESLNPDRKYTVKFGDVIVKDYTIVQDMIKVKIPTAAISGITSIKLAWDNITSNNGFVFTVNDFISLNSVSVNADETIATVRLESLDGDFISVSSSTLTTVNNSVPYIIKIGNQSAEIISAFRGLNYADVKVKLPTSMKGTLPITLESNGFVFSTSLAITSRLFDMDYITDLEASNVDKKKDVVIAMSGNIESVDTTMIKVGGQEYDYNIKIGGTKAVIKLAGNVWGTQLIVVTIPNGVTGKTTITFEKRSKGSTGNFTELTKTLSYTVPK